MLLAFHPTCVCVLLISTMRSFSSWAGTKFLFSQYSSYKSCPSVEWLAWPGFLQKPPYFWHAILQSGVFRNTHVIYRRNACTVKGSSYSSQRLGSNTGTASVKAWSTEKGKQGQPTRKNTGFASGCFLFTISNSLPDRRAVFTSHGWGISLSNTTVPGRVGWGLPVIRQTNSALLNLGWSLDSSGRLFTNTEPQVHPDLIGPVWILSISRF